MVFPRGFSSPQLRVLDRLYHHHAHHFHAAYLNHLKKQTLRAAGCRTLDPFQSHADYLATRGRYMVEIGNFRCQPAKTARAMGRR